MRTRLIASLALALALAIPASAFAGLYMENPAKPTDGKRSGPKHPDSSYRMSASSYGYAGGFPIDRPDNRPNPHRTHQPKPAPPWERPKLF